MCSPRPNTSSDSGIVPCSFLRCGIGTCGSYPGTVTANYVSGRTFSLPRVVLREESLLEYLPHHWCTLVVIMQDRFIPSREKGKPVVLSTLFSIGLIPVVVISVRGYYQRAD